MYALVVVGLGLTVIPGLFTHQGPNDANTAVTSMLSGCALLCVLGLRYPLAMLPILFWEIAWKTIWLLVYAWPAWRAGPLDAYTQSTAFACLMGIILTPIAVPWGYVIDTYLRKSTPSSR